MQSYKSGDFYFKNSQPVGVVLDVTTVNEDFANYKAIHYATTLELWNDSIVSGNCFMDCCDVYRLSEGPDELIGFIKGEVDGSYTWESSKGSWEVRPGKTLREWCDSLKPHEVLGFIVGGYIRASEKKLEAHFNQVFA